MLDAARVTPGASRTLGRFSATMVALTIAVTAVAVAVAAGAASAPPRVVDKPRLIFDRANPNGGLTAYVRFNREVPAAASGTSQVRVSIDTADGPALEPAVRAGRRSRHCYSVLSLDNAPKGIRTGKFIKLLVDVGPRSSFKRFRFTVKAQGLDPFPTRDSKNPVLKSMGCLAAR